MSSGSSAHINQLLLLLIRLVIRQPHLDDEGSDHQWWSVLGQLVQVLKLQMKGVLLSVWDLSDRFLTLSQ